MRGVRVCVGEESVAVSAHRARWAANSSESGGGATSGHQDIPPRGIRVKVTLALELRKVQNVFCE